MGLLEQLLLAQFASFSLVLARVGAMVMTAPTFSSTAIPLHARAFLAVALTLLVAPLQLPSLSASLTNLPQFASLMASEALLGMLLGLGVMVLLQGVQLTGQIISQIGGTAVAESFDPTLDANSAVFSQLLYLLTLTLFLLMDGHRLMIEAVLDTYLVFPPGKAALGDSYVATLTLLLSHSFVLGIRAAAPALAALLLATLMLGLIGRTMPQINILAVGFGLNAMLTLGILMLSIGAVAYAFPQQGLAAIDLIQAALPQPLP